jgi:tetratricopeptide (TPR) repeat protein
VAEGRAWRTRSLDCPGEDESLHGWILLRLTTGSWASASGPGSAETLLQVEGMGQRSGDEQLVAATLEWRGLVGDDGRSETYLDEAARIYRRLGLLDDLARLAINRTAMALNRGEDEGALETADEAIALTREQGNRHGVGVSLANKAIALALLGRVDAVPAVLIEADEAFSSIGESFDYFLLAAVAAHLDVLEDRIDGTTALLLRTIDRAFDREDYSAEPSDERLLAPVRAQVAVLDAGISTPGVDQDSDLGPADALHRWLRARGR